MNLQDCVWEIRYQIIMKTILQKRENSLQQYNLVHKFIPMPQAMKIPAAEAAVDKEWEKLEKISAWNLTKVRSKKEVIDEARTSGATVHFASLMDICHLKNAELEAKHQKYKGGVVLRGDIVKDDSGSYAVFTEQGSSASQTTAAKIMDIISRLPGCDGQAADAVSVHTQVKMEDAPKLLVPKKGDISRLCNWRPISLVPTLYKVYELCMWKVLDKELRPLPNQLVGFRPGMQCLDIVSFLVEALRKADEWGEKLFVVSMDVASAFDSVSAQVLGDVLLERSATVATVAAAVRENLDLSARPCMGFTKCPPFNLEVGMRQGGPRTPSGWNQVMAVLVEELLLLWANRGPAVSWAPEWKAFEMLIWADNIFLVSSSIIDIVQRTQDIEHVFPRRWCSSRRA